MLLHDISKYKPVIAWWSGGVTSAVTCMLCCQWFGKERTRIVFIDTGNEYPDTYKFKEQCEHWYGQKIETIRSKNYNSIQEVWYKYLSLNVASGAVCSTDLKRLVREEFQKNNMFSFQAFGFDIDEIRRAKSLKINHPDCKPIFPLINSLLTKKDCIKMIEEANSLFMEIQIPMAYKLGYQNNNCGQTGCVQGGIGYWQLKKKLEPEQFEAMAKVEHELTDLKGEPVTMLKDQAKGGGLLFLKPHPKYPHVKDISMKKGMEVKPLLECNGFCGTNDLVKNETEKELNYVESPA